MGTVAAGYRQDLRDGHYRFLPPPAPLRAAEIQRGDVPKSIQYHMKEKNISEIASRDSIKCLIRNYWKKLNKEHAISSNYVESFRKVLVDIPRTTQCFYQYGDGYGEPDRETMERIIGIIIKPISL
ncbi:hypothetical protein M5K25_025509 [Dendrobium thyrsiflorum]|uniref:Uncharacterized protein n=1 Tax=Dendrobium thyrsiflorum TaxID=117978 RepID=A0ABD0U4E1_DENTH